MIRLVLHNRIANFTKAILISIFFTRKGKQGFNTFKRQPYTMIKQTQNNSLAFADELSVFDHFMRLELKGLTS